MPNVPWQALAGPAGRWLLRCLPGFVLRQYYNAEALAEDIKLRLHGESGTKLTRPREGLVAPSLEILGELFNMSPLDVHVTAVRSFLSYDSLQGGSVFAECDVWNSFHVRRGSSSTFGVTYRLNQFQMAILSSFIERNIPLHIHFCLYVHSRAGIARPAKSFWVASSALR